MENFVRNSKQNIEKEIERIERQPIAPLDKIKQIIDIIQMSLILLKSAEYQFPNLKEEILFFKTWKPQISGLLMFYVRLYQIEKKRIGESPSSQCKYLKSELENLKKHFLNNSFYDYYRTGTTNNILSEETMIFWQTPVSGCWTGILLSLPCMIQVWLKS